MFSYRHAFHAGNHADVLKHAVIIQLMRYMINKDAPVMIVDTHAGAGVYVLDDTFAAKSGESESGIGRLWNRTDLPPMLADYVGMVKSLNPSGKMRHYPGSPWCADLVMREQDRLRLFELHAADCKLLQDNFRKRDMHAAAQGQRPQTRGKRVLIERSDGFLALKALLPPPSRRALVLIDPPYEDKADYRRVVDTLADALQRFPSGTYAVWYPVLQRLESRQLPERLKRFCAGDWLHVALSIGAPSPDGFGLRASGMFIINPPWTLIAALKETMPAMTTALAIDAEASFTLETGSGNAPKARATRQ